MLGLVNARGPRFRLFGTPVTVHWGFFVLVALLAFVSGGPLIYGVMLSGVIFVSILIHEFGHAAAFAAYGRSSRVVIHGFGGLTVSEDGADLRDGQAIVVSFAGPGAEIVLGLAALAVQQSGFAAGNIYAEAILRDLVWVNLLWGLVNLAPVLPLDGGHVVERLTHRFAPALTSTLPAFVGVAFTIPLAVFAWVNGFALGAIFAAMFGFMNLRMLLGGIDEPKRQRRVDDAQRALSLLQSADPGEAIGALEAVIADTLPQELEDRCVEGLAWALAWRNAPGDIDRVGNLVDRLRGQRDVALLSALVALSQDRAAEASALLVRGLAHERTEPPPWLLPRMLPDADAVTSVAGWIDQLGWDERHQGLGRLAASLERSGRPADANGVRRLMSRPGV